MSASISPNTVDGNSQFNLNLSDPSASFNPSVTYVMILSDPELSTEYFNNSYMIITPNVIIFTFSGGIVPNALYNINVISSNSSYSQSFPSAITVTCFNKGTLIKCQINDKDIDMKIEDIKIGTLIKTTHGYNKLLHKPHMKIRNNIKNDSSCMFKLKNSELIVTGGHSLLVDELTEDQKEKTIKIWNNLPMKDGKYLLLSMFNPDFERLENDDEYEIYHIVLENDDDKDFYGIYAHNILTESMSINCCVEKKMDNYHCHNMISTLKVM